MGCLARDCAAAFMGLAAALGTERLYPGVRLLPSAVLWLICTRGKWSISLLFQLCVHCSVTWMEQGLGDDPLTTSGRGMEAERPVVGVTVNLMDSLWKIKCFTF